MSVALITGASRGIGKAVALALAEEGYSLILNASRSVAELEALAASLPDAIAVCADVGSPEGVAHLVEAGLARYGEIDVLVNNAGISRQGLFTDLTDGELERMYAVNLRGPMLTCRAVLPGMIRRHRGSIVNVSSIWGMVGASCEVDYSAMKAGLIGFTKALAKEVGPAGVRVNCVAPGVIDTAMNGALSPETAAALCEDTPLCRMGTAKEVAETVRFLCSEKGGFFTGQVLSPNGGFVIT